jgi:putative ABC transport system permease protein
MVIITALCLIIGIGAGSFAAQPISDSLLSRQIEAAQRIQERSGDDFFTMQIGDHSKTIDDTPIDKVNVALGVDTMLQIMLISLLLASAAGLAAISRITKYEPIILLTERS